MRVQLLFTLACATSLAIASIAQPPARPHSRVTKEDITHAASLPAPGERAFQANCGRCHTAPEQLSPRITGTVLRHMRVRANLSQQDEREILRFLAP